MTKWFNKIENKSTKIFIKLHIVDFYPSITKQIVTNATNFVKTYTNISNEEVNVIIHACKLVLSHKTKLWSKSSSNSNFAMGLVPFTVLKSAT